MISVLMPAYNTARFIRCAIQSVLDQDVAMPMEIVAVDDGSTDDTADIVRQMANARQGNHKAKRRRDRKSTRLNSSHRCISYAVFCLKKKTNTDLF